MFLVSLLFLGCCHQQSVEIDEESNIGIIPLVAGAIGYKFGQQFFREAETEPEANVPPLAVAAAAAVGAYVMDHVQVNVNVHFRAKELLDELEVMYGKLGERKVVKKHVDGGIWVSGTAGQILFSAFYHDSKKHTVGVKPGSGAQTLPKDEEWVEAGQWAIIYTVTKETEGNEAFYSIEDDAEANVIGIHAPVLLPAAIIAHKLAQQFVEENSEEPEANIPPVVAAVAAWAVDWASDHVNINVDFRANEFLDKLEKQLGRKFENRNVNKKQVDGGIWISGSADDVVFSAFYHDSKKHTVGIKAGVEAKTIPEFQDWVEAGKWAIVYTLTKSEIGNQVLYAVDDEDDEKNAPNPWVVFDLEVTIPWSQWFKNDATAEANVPPLAVAAAAAVGAYVMDHVQVNVNVHFRAADLLDELEVMYGKLGERKVAKKNVDGGVWISGTAGNILFSAFYHPSKKHTVRVQAGADAKVLPKDEEWVEAGQWAIIYTVTKATSGNEASYQVEDEDAEANVLVPMPIIPAAALAYKLAQQFVEENSEEPEANIPPLVAAAAAWAVDWASDHVNINVDFRAKDFIDGLEKQLGKKLGNRKINKKQVDGGIWISGSAGDVIFSAYYHDSKKHTVGIKAGDDGEILPKTLEWVEGGKWAIVYTVTKDAKGNKALFTVDDNETNAPKPWVVFDLDVTIPLSQWFGGC